MPIDFNTRCLQIWQVLIASASNRQTITYGQIKSNLKWGVPPFGYGRHLDSILAFCQSRQLPDITVIIVSLDTGRPGTYTGDNLDRDREAVFATDWFAQLPPTREEFANPTQ